MPKYDYKCNYCNKITEQDRKYTEPPLDTCPNCNKCDMVRIYSTGFILVGGCWEKDGYTRNETPV